jgi:hypothetical protein
LSCSLTSMVVAVNSIVHPASHKGPMARRDMEATGAALKSLQYTSTQVCHHWQHRF